MTQLRKMMLDELQRRNYSKTTVNAYLKIVAGFAEHFHRSPDQLGPEEIRAYQVYLFTERKLGARTVGHYTAALRFFFCKTLKRNYPVEEVPYPKAPRRLPTILTQEETVRLIDSASNLFDRAMLMTVYSTGMRRAEMCQLKVEDIDSDRMLIHIRQGKGRRDRDVPLSPKLLETLREYWRWMKPKTYLFPGTINGSRADKPITPKILWEACREAAQRAGITKSVRPHLLRHASAYYTTFQSSFILKTIALGRAQSAAVYGQNGRLALVPARLATRDPFDRSPMAHNVRPVLPEEPVRG